MAIYDCPFQKIIKAAESFAGLIPCVISFGPAEEGAKGYTFFPADEGIPEIFIDPDQTIEQCMDILAHELAHVIVGAEEEHGPKWEETYAKIFDTYKLQNKPED